MRRSIIFVIGSIAFAIGGKEIALAQTRTGAEPKRDTGIAGLYALLDKVGVHPMVEMQRAGVEAARHRIAMKSSLMNPMLMLGVENVPTSNFSFSEEPMTSKMIGISQSFPFPGKLQAEAEIAAQDTVISGTRISEQENELARDIKLAYFEIYHLGRAISTNESHTHTIDQLLAVARSKLETGKATQSEVLDLELERSDIESQVIQDQTMMAMRRAELERASGGVLANTSMPLSLAMPDFSYTLAELDSMTAQHRPLLAGLRSQATQQTLQFKRSDLDMYPDFQVSLQYMQRDALSATSVMNPTNTPAASQLGMVPMPMTQSNMVSATVSVELPFNYGNRRSEALGEADAMRSMKLAEERASMLDIHTELRTDLAKLDGLRKQYALLRDEVYPAVKASLETSNANYTFGKTGIEQVLRDELSLLHREHDRYRLEAEYNETIAAMEYLTGKNLVHYSSLNTWR